LSRILLTVWPLTGHLHPNLALAEGLRRAGHEVAFYTGVTARRLIEGEGFRCFPFGAVDERTVEQLVLSPDGILSTSRRPWRRLALWRAWVLDTLADQVADLRAVIAAWSPAVMATDPTMWAPFLVLHELVSLPVAVFSLIPACHLSGREGPVLGFPLPRPRGSLGRARAFVLRRASEVFLRGMRRGANEVRARYGLPPLDCSVTDFAGRMPLYLVPGSRDFDYGRVDLPPSVEYVGPCLWAGESAPAWLADLPTDQPLVYVSEGTVNLEPKVLRAAALGLAGLPIQVIITTGHHRDPASLGFAQGAPKNIRIERWVPLTPLLPRLRAIVTVGGPSTLLAGLGAGVPVVIVPFDWDHPETAWRVVASGAGIRLAPRECQPRRMRDAVRRVLDDPSFRRNAQRLAASFRAAGGADRAAALIANLARDRPGAAPASVEGSLAWRAS
jgi:MGT family glycosyltransferase